MSIHEFVSEFLIHLESHRHLARASLRGYRQELGLLVRSGIALEEAPLASFVRCSPGGTPLSPSTRNRRLVIVRAFCRFLVERGLLASDPTLRIERVRLPPTFRTAITAEEICQVLQVLGTEPSGWRRTRDEVIVGALFYTGLRVSELQSLELEQVDLEGALLRGVSRKGGRRTDLPLCQTSADLLRRWLAVRSASADERAVFVNGDGERLSVRAIQKRLRDLGERAGLGTRFHPHALRHAHATALLRVGVPTELIRMSLNHSSIATTMRYLHADADLLRTALDRLPELPLKRSVHPGEHR